MIRLWILTLKNTLYEYLDVFWHFCEKSEKTHNFLEIPEFSIFFTYFSILTLKHIVIEKFLKQLSSPESEDSIDYIQSEIAHL